MQVYIKRVQRARDQKRQEEKVHIPKVNSNYMVKSVRLLYCLVLYVVPSRGDRSLYSVSMPINVHSSSNQGV